MVVRLPTAVQAVSPVMEPALPLRLQLAAAKSQLTAPAAAKTEILAKAARSADVALATVGAVVLQHM